MEEGMTRHQHMRSQLFQQTTEIAQLQVIVNAMRHGTDAEAAEVLARLRMGESVEQLCDLLEGSAKR